MSPSLVERAQTRQTVHLGHAAAGGPGAPVALHSAPDLAPAATEEPAAAVAAAEAEAAAMAPAQAALREPPTEAAASERPRRPDTVRRPHAAGGGAR